MRILSIETSCDETGVSILEAKGARSTNSTSSLRASSGQEFKKISFRILANSLNSQIKIHAPFGGVYPALAKREHIKNLPILLERSLKIAKLKNKQKPVDLIAVTSGPGLEPALWTGIVFAKELAKKWNVPLVPVNHMEGHILSVFGKKDKFSIQKIKFPALSLLVSGGHTELVLVQNWGKYKIIGETLDDAAGEAFDKVARMLGLPYPGGPEISRLAELQRTRKEKSRRHIVLGSLGRSDGGDSRKFSAENFCADKNNMPREFIKLPRPMLYSKNFDFSFSGLKTAVLYIIRDLKMENSNILQNNKIKQAIALEFENAVVETLVYKTKKAIEKYKVKTLIVAGGVSANKFLQKEIKKMAKGKVEVLFPGKELTGDNAIMIGITGYLNFLKKNKKTTKAHRIKADGGLRL